MKKDHAQHSSNLTPPINRYPNIFFLIARDLTLIQPMPGYSPFSGQWNAYIPFVKIDKREIAELSAIGNIEIGG